MKLLIDFGNSQCKWALLRAGEWVDLKAYAYEFKTPADSIEKMLQLMPISDVTEINAVSVLGDLFDIEFSHDVKHATGVRTKFYPSQSSAYGVTLAYSDPSTYGADRFATLVAAHHLEQGTKVIIDAGTATTVDVIDTHGKHLGGLIMPGIELMCSALAARAPGIEMPQEAISVRLLNATTQKAVYSGSVLTLRHGLLGVIEEIKQSIDDKLSVYITGGESALLDFSSPEFITRPELVLEGLHIMQGQ